MRQKMKVKNSVRLQIEISPDYDKELEALMKECRVATKKDLVNNALTLFSWAVKQRGAGRLIASLDETNMRYREIQMPALNAVKRSKEESMAYATTS